MVKWEKKSSMILKNCKRHFLSCDVFISLFEKKIRVGSAGKIKIYLVLPSNHKDLLMSVIVIHFVVWAGDTVSP